MLTSAEARAIQRETRARRNFAAAERRANGLAFRKVPIVVALIETTDPTTGRRLLLASSDAPAERGRWFQVERNPAGGERWRCCCGAFRLLGGCPQAAHVAAMAAEREAA